MTLLAPYNYSEDDHRAGAWTCNICGDGRPYDAISVRHLPIEHDGQLVPGATYNLRYCNDRPDCVDAAVTNLTPYRLDAT